MLARINTGATIYANGSFVVRLQLDWIDTCWVLELYYRRAEL